jgi:LruC domain-containing protein
MKISSKLALASGLLLMHASCQKEDHSNASSLPGSQVDHFDQMEVSSHFNWTAGVKELSRITVEPAFWMDLEGEELQIINQKGNTVASSLIENVTAMFFHHYSEVGTKYRYFLPASQEKWPLTGGDQTLTMENPYQRNAPRSGKQQWAKGKMTEASQGPNLLSDPGFEQYNLTVGDMMGSTPTPQHDQWYVMGENYRRVKSGGDYQVEYYDKGSSGSSEEDGPRRIPGVLVTQTVSIPESGTYVAFAQVKGDVDLHVSTLDGIGEFNKYEFSSNNAGQKTLQVSISASEETKYINVVLMLGNYTQEAWIDDVKLQQTGAPQDSDKDGVNDLNDDFPNDPSAVRAEFYPFDGSQTVAFEDLWPNKGDYDFNDLVISSKLTLATDENYRVVRLKGRVAVEAMGAGKENGLALNLKTRGGLEVMKNSSRSFIQSVSGDAKIDPHNGNGLVLYDRPRDVIDPVYWNTKGNYQTPDTLEFTVTLKPESNIHMLMPEYFIFDANNRNAETHLPGNQPVAPQNINLKGTADENGDYRTAKGLPWGMEVILPPGTSFRFPRERVDITDAYDDFSSWAVSMGRENWDWYQNANAGKVVNPPNTQQNRR